MITSHNEDFDIRRSNSTSNEITLTSDGLRITDGYHLYTWQGSNTAGGQVHLARNTRISFYGDESAHHSIGSRNQSNGEADDLMISSYGAVYICLLYTSPSPRDLYRSRMPSSA